MDKLAGVVLCGGRSSRMGTDKSRLDYGGVSLCEHMCQLLRSGGLDNVFISGPDDIRDLLPGHGPLGGIHACVHTLSKDFTHALFVPVDMPLLVPLQIRELVMHASDAEILHYQDQIFPLKLALSPRTKNKLDSQLALDRLSLKSLIATLPAESLLPHDRSTFTNINTPQQWQAVIATNSSDQKVGR